MQVMFPRFDQLIYFVGRRAFWVVGHYYVFCDAQRVECCPGCRSFCFQAALERNPQLVVVPGPAAGGRHQSGHLGPVALVLHAGGNDLCLVRMGELLAM